MSTALFDAIREIKGRGLTQAEVDRINAILAGKAPALPAYVANAITAEPNWIKVARSLLGQREIPGPQHNAWIAKGWARLKAGWFTDDETPWCGFFIAHCMDAVGLPYPGGGKFAQAAAWADYGVKCNAQLGAIGVKKRTGGNHVFFIVGETPDGKFYKALGGNQSNAVTIMDIAKADAFAIRWPSEVVQANIPLPVLPAGVVSRNEA